MKESWVTMAERVTEVERILSNLWKRKLLRSNISYLFVMVRH